MRFELTKKGILTSSDIEVVDATSQNTKNTKPFKRPPDMLVLHYTAGGTVESSVSWLLEKSTKASAHFLVGRTGKIFQLTETTLIAWHAGVSSWDAGGEWKKRTGINNYSLGVEFANYGPLCFDEKTGDFHTNGKSVVKPFDVYTAPTRGGVDENFVVAYHERYKDEQLAVGFALCDFLVDRLCLTTIVGHEEISPGRKFDPGPAFPLAEWRHKLVDR